MSALHPTILIIDDDPQIYRYLRPAMTEAGYSAVNNPSGLSGLQAINTNPPDAVILDIDIRDMRGEDLLARARGSFQGPILVLSARSRDIEKINALDLGADDFVAKPFGVGELLARLRVAFRRRMLRGGLNPIVRARGLTVNLVTRIVALRGVSVSLTPQQYAILACLASAGGAAVTHSELAIRSDPEGGAKSRQDLRILIRQLRGKIEETPKMPLIITTERNVGYRLNVDRE